MPYDAARAEGIRRLLAHLQLEEGEELAEKKMFGGLCFTLNGKMLVGVVQNRVVIRLGTIELQEALDANRVLPMDFTGRPLSNFAYLAPDECEPADTLLRWVNESLRFVRAQMLAHLSPKKG